MSFYRFSNRAIPNVNTFLASKVFFYDHPVFTLSFLLIVGILITGYCLYVVERWVEYVYLLFREAQPDEWSFLISIFVTFTCMLNGWATDVYDEWNPVTLTGKLICLVRDRELVTLLEYSDSWNLPLCTSNWLRTSKDETFSLAGCFMKKSFLISRYQLLTLWIVSKCKISKEMKLQNLFKLLGKYIFGRSCKVEKWKVLKTHLLLG